MDIVENVSLKPAKNGLILNISGKKYIKPAGGKKQTYSGCDYSRCDEQEVFSKGEEDKAVARMLECAKKMYKEEDKEENKEEY